MGLGLPFRNKNAHSSFSLHHLHRPHAHRHHPLEQAYHLLPVVREAVGIELLGDGGVAGFLLLVLVQHPFQGAAVAELYARIHREEIEDAR